MGGPVTVKAIFAGKSAWAQIVPVDTPVIRRINFQVKDHIDRKGWEADNGKPYTDSRGFGWVGAPHLDFRDDRISAHNLFLQSFVVAKENVFSVSEPEGCYSVRVAMGDSDYGAVPFSGWVECNGEKLIYYEGHHNSASVAVSAVSVIKRELRPQTDCATSLIRIRPLSATAFNCAASPPRVSAHMPATMSTA